MKYTKHPIDLPLQLEKLKQRGLTIANEEIALEQLHSISYFRLANYWNTMESQTDKHQFLPNSNFEDIIKTYTFDKRLRTLVFTSIQDVEIALRTRIIQFFSLKYGSFWFMDANLFKDTNIHESCLGSVQNIV